MWDVRLARDETSSYERLASLLARVIAERLPQHKKLIRVVAWSADAGRLFAPEPGVRRYAVAYQVAAA